MLFKLREVKHSDIDDSQYLHALTYVDLDNETLRPLQLDNEWRLQALGGALDYIIAQRSVPERKMKSALTEQQFAAYVESFDWLMSHVEDEQSDDMPMELKEYLDLVRQGDRYTRIANLFVRSKKKDHNGKTAFVRYFDKAFACYEDAVMDLCNCIDINPSRNPLPDPILSGTIQRFLDRSVSVEDGEGPDISPSGVPRLRGSKSKYTQIDAEPVVGERLRRYWRQREALCAAALELIYDEPEEALTERQQEILRERMRTLFGTKLPVQREKSAGRSKLQQLLDDDDREK